MLPVIKISGVFFHREVRMAGGNRTIYFWGVGGGKGKGIIVEMCLFVPFVRDDRETITVTQSLKICVTLSKLLHCNFLYW